MPPTHTFQCSSCGSVLLAGERFCGTCGTPTPVSSPGVTMPGGEAGSAWDMVLRQLRAATLGEFEIKRELGRGGMAAVYLAHEIALNRKVALKVMAPGVMMGEGMIERFRFEAVTIANLSHPNIVRIHAVRQAADIHFFVMQYLAGRSLERILGESGPLPIPIVRVLLAEVAAALGYAHRRGVVHRDIKPGNILLDVTGDAVVTDFGIAKVAEAPSQTLAGSVVGTPAYMSPEQCYAHALTGASDQYSLGIVAYEMLTGKVPFSGAAFAVMQGHTHGTIPPVTDLRPDCPADLDGIVRRMLAREPGDRFATMADVAKAASAGPLGDHDPLRDQLVALAAIDESAALDATVPTPLSPIPQTRRNTAQPPPPASQPVTPITPRPMVSAPQPSAAALAADRTVVEPAALAPPPAAPRTAAPRRLRPWMWATPLAAVAAVGIYLLVRGRADPSVVVAPRPPDGTSVPSAPTADSTSIQLAGVPFEIPVGESFSPTATFSGPDSIAAQPVRWSSGATAVVAVDAATGRARAIRAGTAMIVVRRGALADSAEVTVLADSGPAAAVAARVVILPPAAPVRANDRVRLRAQVEADGRRSAATAPAWSSSDPRIATIDARSGELRAVSAGRAIITARASGSEGRLRLTIQPSEVRLPPPGPVEPPRDTVVRTTPAAPGPVASTPAPPTPDPPRPTTPVKSAAELRAELEAVVRAYAQAIESGDLARVRAAFPTIAPTQIEGYRTFFEFARDVDITIGRIDVADPLSAAVGSEARARVPYTIQYNNRSIRRVERESAQWQAVLERSATGWRLVSIR